MSKISKKIIFKCCYVNITPPSSTLLEIQIAFIDTLNLFSFLIQSDESQMTYSKQNWCRSTSGCAYIVFKFCCTNFFKLAYMLTSRNSFDMFWIAVMAPVLQLNLRNLVPLWAVTYLNGLELISSCGTTST